MALLINTSFVNSIKSDHSKMTAFSLYLKFKVRYRNGVIYEYNPEKLSKLFKVSGYHIRKSIPILIKLGLITKSVNNTILLTSFTHLKEYGRLQKKVQINMTDSISVVITKLRYALLQSNLIDIQKFIQNTYTKLNKFNLSKKSYVQMKKGKKYLDSIGYDASVNVDVKVYAGYRKMASIMGVSISSVQEILKQVVKWKYMRKFSWLIKKVKDATYGEFLEAKKLNLINGFIFYKDNSIFLHRGTELKFS